MAAKIELQPLDLSPDGEARLLVRIRYADAAGTRVNIPPGGHVDVWANRGRVAWQPRAQYGGPAAIVRLTEAGPLEVRVASDLARLPATLRASSDTRAWRLPAVTARALGPHAVIVGWFPRVHHGTVHIARSDADGRRMELASVAAPASTFRDTTAQPGAHYTYEVRRPHEHRIEAGVDMPPELPVSGSDTVRGKAMWLAFDDVARWNVESMLDRARAAGIRAVELRLTYGEYAQITPARKATVDRFIDGAAERGIAIVAWTVPRALTYEDLAANVAAAAYRTRNGHGIEGIAVDLERGADFLGSDRSIGVTLADYIRRLREAVGPHVLLIATVEDPFLERLADETIPIAAIARYADVLQPMTYWRMRAAGASTDGMRSAMTASYATVVRLAGRPIPIDVGGQTANLGNRYGAPPPAEVEASIAHARSLGAIGETLYDWDGTSAAQWAAIARAPWPTGKPARQ